MLAALEQLLAADGVEEVRLDTRVANQASLASTQLQAMKRSTVTNTG